MSLSSKWRTLEKSNGAKGNRTLDLLNAIQALSHLSYSPGLCGALSRPENYTSVLVLCPETALCSSQLLHESIGALRYKNQDTRLAPTADEGAS